MGAKRIIPFTAALLAVLFTQPALAQKPKPGTLETYKDWTIGCDNRGRCEMTSLIPEDGNWPDQPLILDMSRDAGPDAELDIHVLHDGKGKQKLGFLVDGRSIATATSINGEASLTGAEAAALAIAMAKGSAMDIRAGGRSVGKPSLAGTAAALRYMDARQGRAGTRGALVATGPLARSAIRPAPPVPTVRRAIIPAGAEPAPLWREELTALGKFTGCTDEMRDASPPELHRLSKTETLVLVPCGAGAYNFSSVPVIATGIAGRRAFRFATFDYQPGWSENAAQPMLVNASWAPEASRLQSYAKGRGLGDCGGSETYAWDGATFRLVEASAMGECRGSYHWITTWSARVIE